MIDGDRLAALEAAKSGLTLAKQYGNIEWEEVAQSVIQRIEDEKPVEAQTKVNVVQAPAPGAAQVSTATEVVKENPGLSVDVVQDLVSSTVRDIMLDEEISDDVGLMEAGMDSLATIAFRNQLGNRLGMQLTNTLVFDYPSVNMISAYIVEQSKLLPQLPVIKSQ